MEYILNENSSSDAMLLFVSETSPRVLTTYGQNHIAQDTHALFDFLHEGTQPIMIEHELVVATAYVTGSNTVRVFLARTLET